MKEIKIGRKGQIRSADEPHGAQWPPNPSLAIRGARILGFVSIV